MKIFEKPDEIIIRYVPVWKWIFGGILTSIIGVCFLFLLYSLFVNSSGLKISSLIELFETAPFILIGGTFLLVLFEIKMIRAPLITVTVSQTAKRIDILQWRFYGSETQRLYFTQINKFKSYKGKVNFSSKYFLALILANQKTIKLKIPIGGDKQKTIKLIKKLNKFVKYQFLERKMNDE